MSSSRTFSKSWIDVRASFLEAAPLIELSDIPGQPLQGAFTDLPNSIAKYSYLNITPIGWSSFGTCNSATGQYNGIFGDLSRNITSYTMIAAPQSYRINNCSGLKFSRLLHAQHHTISMSPMEDEFGPKSNREFYQSLFVLDSVITSTLISVIFICYLSWFLFSKILTRRGKKIKKFGFIEWFIPLIFRQTLPSRKKFKTHIILSIAIRTFILLISWVILSGMNPELVVYSQPKLIESISDLVESNKTITFNSGSELYHDLQDTIDGRRIKDKLKNQKEQILYDTQSGILLEFDQMIINQNMAHVGLSISNKIAECIYCQRPEQKSKSSEFYVSKNSFFIYHTSLAVSAHINPEVERRLVLYTARAMAGGLYELQIHRSAELTTSSIPVLGIPSLECLNSYAWDKPTNQINPIGINTFLKFLLQISLLHLIAALALHYDIYRFK